MTADVFIVTQVGLDDATSAADAGIFLQLATFKVGSAFGYTPTVSDTGLHGTVLYTDAITSFSTAGDGSLIVNCTIDVNAGPFDFGEVGIYTTGGALFALMALPALEHKYTALGSNVASTFTFQCYLRLGQAGGIIEIVASGGGGGTSNFVYTMNSGQPPALWGTTDGGINSQVWNPSNFNVATAGIATVARGVANGGAATYAASSHTFYAADGATHLADISSGGVITCVNVAITSDIRFKNSIEPIEDSTALDVMMGLTGITYEHNDFPGQKHVGLPAQQLQELFPHGVIADADGKLAVSYAQTMAALTPGAIRSIVERLEIAERKLELLEA